jgi:gamma-glutamylcysteine synthetase
MTNKEEDMIIPKQTHIKENPAQVFKSSFRADVDFRSEEPRYVGIENEYLMVYSDGMLISRETLGHFWQELADRGWAVSRDHILGTVVTAIRKRDNLVAKKEYNYDVITTEFGFSTLEIALAPAQTLKEAHAHLYKVLTLVTSILSKYSVYLLGYGVQPIACPEREYLGASSRYELVYAIYEDEDMFGQDAFKIDIHCLSAASQTQVEVSTSEAIPVVNALNATSGLRIALLANSSVWQSKVSGYKAIRQLFWDWCWPNRKLQVGIPPRFQSIEHYLDYIFDFRAIMVKRDQELYRLNNNLAFRQFFWNENGQEGITLDGHKVKILSKIDDIKLQCGFAWFDTRLQAAHGTVEDRVSCQQPPHEHFCASG